MRLGRHGKSALCALSANKARTGLTMLGITIGVLSVTLLVAVGEGTQRFVEQSLSSLGTNLLSVVPGRVEGQRLGYAGAAVEEPLVDADIQLIRRHASSVAATTPVIFGSAALKNSGRQRATSVFGVGTEFLTVRGLGLDSGSFFGPEDEQGRRRVAVLGRTIVRTLFDDASPVGQDVRIGTERFRVIGVIEQKGLSLGVDLDDLALVPTSVAKELFGQRGISQILAVVRSGASAEVASREVEALLAGRRRGERTFTIQTQDDLRATVSSVTDALRFCLLAIASISLLVGGVGVMNIMLVSVRERTREIGVRRAVGATRRDILLQFLIESVVITTLGGTAGLLLGALGLLALSVIDSRLPFGISVEMSLTALASAVAVGVLSGLHPAHKAAALDPAQAVRCE